MVVYDERNNRLEVVNLLSNRKRYIDCAGIDPLTDKVLSVDEFGDEIRVRVAPRAGPQAGSGVVRLIKYSLSQASDAPGAANARAAGSAPTQTGPTNPFAARDPKSRF